MKIFMALLTALSIVSLAQAETRYVSDQMEITMRSGQSTQHNIVRMLKSGLPVEVMETDAEAGYVRVRLASGTEGWVLSRFLQHDPVARDRLAELEKKVAALRDQKQLTDAGLQQTRSEKATLDKERSRLSVETKKLSRELSELRRTAANPIAISAENKTLKAHIATIEDELQTLKHKYRAMEDQTAQNWFMTGAGVILLGMIVGLILPNMRFGRKKRSQWGSL
ncbi:MAG: TIGR04211 family SH3 domain-containing protein [Mariprofundaceae bacterium]